MGTKLMTLVIIAVSVFLLFGLFGCDQKTDTNTSGTNNTAGNNTVGNNSGNGSNAGATGAIPQPPALPE